MPRFALPSRARCASRAFTLIELLVVISVIALLVGILLPALASARQRARSTQGLANLSQIARAVHGYAQDWRDMLPVGYLKNSSPADTDWTCILNAAMTGNGATYVTVDRARYSKVFRDPNAAVAGGLVHYSCHPVLMPDLTTPTVLDTYRLGRARRPAELVLVTDGCQELPDWNSNATLWQVDHKGLWGAGNLPIYYDPAAADNAQPIDPGPNADTDVAAGTIRWRQSGGRAANILFLDSHARTVWIGGVSNGNLRADK